MRIADSHLDRKSQILEHELKEIERQLLNLQREQNSYHTRITERQNRFQAVFRQIEKNGVLSRSSRVFISRAPNEETKIRDLQLHSSRVQERVNKVLREKQQREHTLKRLETILAERRQNKLSTAEQEELDEQVPYRLSVRKREQENSNSRIESRSSSTDSDSGSQCSQDNCEGGFSNSNPGQTDQDQSALSSNSGDSQAQGETGTPGEPNRESHQQPGFKENRTVEILSEPQDQPPSKAGHFGIDQLKKLNFDYADGVQLTFTTSNGKRIEIEVLQIEKRTVSLFLFPIDHFTEHALKQATAEIHSQLESRGFRIAEFVVV